MKNEKVCAGLSHSESHRIHTAIKLVSATEPNRWTIGQEIATYMGDSVVDLSLSLPTLYPYCVLGAKGLVLFPQPGRQSRGNPAPNYLEYFIQVFARRRDPDLVRVCIMIRASPSYRMGWRAEEGRKEGREGNMFDKRFRGRKKGVNFKSEVALVS